VVARTRVLQPWQGTGKPRLVSPALTTSQSHELSYSNVRICIASQQSESYEAGHYVCSELASHDACVSLLINHLTGGLNVLVFVALRFDNAYHYSVASSHQHRFGSD
jgi:hypothetical protein